MTKRLLLLTVALGMGMLSLAGYQWARASAAKDIYRDRLASLEGEYTQLVEQYNQAVTPKPVTELLVEDGKVSIIVRQAGGVLETITTPYRADREIFVDFALIDGRLLIRRIFDDHTAPAYATPIDETLLEVDWNAPGADYGKAIYRKLDEGRWIVSVTGDGSLGLKQVELDQDIDLTRAPAVQEYAPVQPRADEDVENIRFGEVWQHLMQ